MPHTLLQSRKLQMHGLHKFILGVCVCVCTAGYCLRFPLNEFVVLGEYGRREINDAHISQEAIR